MKKILSLIDAGKKEGAQCVAGGKRHGNKGYFVEPTVFANVNEKMRIAQEEVHVRIFTATMVRSLRLNVQIFGPVQQLIRFDNMEDLVEKANNTVYGLAAGVITNDLDKALHVANNIRAGTVWLVTSYFSSILK